MTAPLQYRALERIVRGFSCHRRIQILALLEQSPQPLSLSQISASCRTNIKPICEHVQRLHLAGLVIKRSRGRETLHHLTPLGQQIIAFLRTIP
jgi:predicted transcriptional regulator